MDPMGYNMEDGKRHTYDESEDLVWFLSLLDFEASTLCHKKHNKHRNAFGKFKESMFCKNGATVVTPQLLVVHRRTDGRFFF